MKKMVYPIKVMRAMVDTLVHVRTFHDFLGICSNFDDKIERHAIFEKYGYDYFSEFLTKLFKIWPEFSGDDCYPINVDKFTSPKSEYFICGDRWDGEYGEARHRLINFCIRELEDMIEFALIETGWKEEDE